MRTAKGSIDVLDRERTSVLYTPKISNLAGRIAGGKLSGQHSALFIAEFQEDGKLAVRARNDAILMTNATYQVELVFMVEVEDYSEYEIKSKPLKIKVKQGKPKITLSSKGGNTLYRQLHNEIEITFNAPLNQNPVVIEDVSPLNYTGDIHYQYEPNTPKIRLSMKYDGKEILQSGKTWSVKFNVRYRDQAGNVKDTQVTYKVVVK